MVRNLREEACRSALRLQEAAGGDEQPEGTHLNCPGTAEGEPDMLLVPQARHNLGVLEFNNMHLIARCQLAWSSRERATKGGRVNFQGRA